MPPVNRTDTLLLEFEIEDLSPAQVAYYNSINDQFDAYKLKLEQLSRSNEATVENIGELTLVEFQQLPSKASGNIVVVDPKTINFIVSAPGSSVQSAPQVSLPANSGVRFVPPTPGSSNVRTSAPAGLRVRGGLGNTAIRTRAPLPSSSPKGRPPGLIPPRGGHTGSASSRADVVKKNDFVDLTDEDCEGNDFSAARAEKEVSITKNSEKTYPSLVVLARPFLNLKKYTSTQIQSERCKLDDKVKTILTLRASQLSEWLLQHGLLRSEQTCHASSARAKTHQPLKLGMYSDSSKFPFSGGYVWISDCCPTQFVSVFTGSIFEAAAHPPTVVIKLIYHWACQTGVQNVIQWVKVDTLYVKTLYTNLRAICTAAVHQRFPVFGGQQKRVQIGVISLGTTTQDGSSRQVKVEVLGLLDEETKMLRIRAIEPATPDPSLSQQQQIKVRFKKSLDLLPKWVSQASEIVIDHTVDKQTLSDFGFKNVIQVSQGDTEHGYEIMDYLRKIIPRMFQNTLSLLSRQIIQQFLDELSWREAYGPIPSRAFESIVEHISEQTRLNTGGTLLNRLSRISANPFRDWAYDNWAGNCKKSYASELLASSKGVALTPSAALNPNAGGSKKKDTAPSSTATPAASHFPAQKKQGSKDPTLIALEPYYYGVLEGDASKAKYVPFFTQCYFCRKDFKNVIKLTDHLVLHALNKTMDNFTEPRDICRLCLKIRLPGSKQHHAQMCNPSTLNPGCRICVIKMKDKGSLVYHMTKTHHQLDMPYRCDKCGYRVSEYELLHNHFNKIHNNGVSGMCPFCLKVVDFATEEGNDLEHNQVFFIKHLQRHVLPSSKKCSRCILNFVNKSILSAHEFEMHASQENNPDVMRFLVDDPTLMPAPIVGPPLVHAMQPGDLKPTGVLKGISTVQLGIHALIDEAIGAICHECESPITPDHFVNYLMCNKCSYRSCCGHAMAEHVSLLHPPYPLSSPVYVGMKTNTGQIGYCSQCSYTSRDGNRMSNHLVTCGNGSCHLGKRRTPLPPAEEISLPTKVRKRRSKRTRVLSDTEDESDPQPSTKPKTVLNSVGLVRKSTDDEASQGAGEGDVPDVTDEPMATGDADIPIEPEVSMVEGSSGLHIAPEVPGIVTIEDDNS